MKYENPIEAIEALSESYPLPQSELKAIVDAIRPVVEDAAQRVERLKTSITSNLSQRESARVEGFLFYYQKMLEHDVSPISVTMSSHQGGYYSPDFRIGERSWAWQGVADVGIPYYSGNNFWNFFWKDNGKIIREEEDLDRILEEHREVILERFRTGQLLLGDSSFAENPFENYLWMKKSEGKTLTKEEIEKARIDYDGKNILRYVDWQGKEIRVGRTLFEAWEEFKDENPELILGLVEICNLDRDIISERRDEFDLLLSKAFTLMRVKGFPTYPGHL